MTLSERVMRWVRKLFRGNAKMLTCQEQVELLADYLDGTLQPETASALERHLEDCVACVNFTKTYKATKTWVRDLTYEEMPEDLKTRLASFLKVKILQEQPGGDH